MTNPLLKLLKLRQAGMFSNVNEVVEQLHLAETQGYRFLINWQESCYLDTSRQADVWNYYFEPCFTDTVRDQSTLPELPRGTPVACTRNNIITPRLDDGICAPLLLPRDRFRAHEIIDRYLRLKPEVAAGINTFRETHFGPQMIGLHIRGPGRTDGGVPALRQRFGSAQDVPVEVFFQQTDEALRLLPNARIFACSDSSKVMDAIQQRYGTRMVSWPALRSEFGEMHANHTANTGQSFAPYQLGLDVLSEAWLLSQTDILVHGNSNVANFVISKSPHLIHAYVQA